MSHKTSKITGSSTLFHQPQVMVPPREARCFDVPKGHFFRICCVEGPQVVGRWVAAAVLKKALQLIISYHNNPYPIHIIHSHTISNKIAYQNENTLGPIIWIHMMWNQNILCHIDHTMTYQTMSNQNMFWYHIIHHDISYHLKSEHIAFQHAISSRNILYHIMPGHITSYSIMPKHNMLYHVMSYQTTTYHIIFKPELTSNQTY